MFPLLPLTGEKNKYNILPILHMAFFHSISRSEIILNQYIHIISSLRNGYTYYTIIQICHKQESQLCMFRLFQVSRYSNNSCIFYQQHKPWYKSQDSPLVSAENGRNCLVGENSQVWGQSAVRLWQARGEEETDFCLLTSRRTSPLSFHQNNQNCITRGDF